MVTMRIVSAVVGLALAWAVVVSSSGMAQSQLMYVDKGNGFEVGWSFGGWGYRWEGIDPSVGSHVRTTSHRWDSTWHVTYRWQARYGLSLFSSAVGTRDDVAVVAPVTPPLSQRTSTRRWMGLWAELSHRWVDAGGRRQTASVSLALCDGTGICRPELSSLHFSHLAIVDPLVFTLSADWWPETQQSQGAGWSSAVGATVHFAVNPYATLGSGLNVAITASGATGVTWHNSWTWQADDVTDLWLGIDIELFSREHTVRGGVTRRFGL